MSNTSKAIVAVVGVVVVAAGLGCERSKDKPGAATTSPAASAPASRAASRAASRPASAPAPATSPSAQLPKVRLMGVESRGRRVIFVSEACGSMMGKFDMLRSALRKSVGALEESQSLNIVMCSEGAKLQYLAVDEGLVPASAAGKEKASAFLERVAPGGGSVPLPGLRAAFAQRPDVIYLITDGDFPDNQGVLDEITRLNKDQSVKVNTIAYMDKGEEYEKLLQRIARENGGTYRFVTGLNVDD